MRVACALACLLVANVAHAAIPPFTPNVVDPQHRLDSAATQRVNALIQRMRDDAGIEAAVWITDRVGDDAIEELANQAFSAWHLGRADRGNGLLLVLSMEDHHMRFEVGYGLESDLTDVTCRHVLDEQLRPQLRNGRLDHAILDGLSALAHVKNPSFVATSHVTRSRRDSSPFAARFGGYAWVVWALIVLGFGLTRRQITRASVGVMLFLIVNPGVFVFVGVSLGFGQYFAGGNTLDDFVRAYGLALPYWLGAAWAAAYAARRAVAYAVEQRLAFCGTSEQVAALEERRKRRAAELPIAATDARGYSIWAGILTAILVALISLACGLPYENPALLAALDLVVLVVAWRIARLFVRRFRTIEAYTEYLTFIVTRPRSSRSVSFDRSSSWDSGSSSSSSSSSDSSSSSSSFDSSSDGGSSGGGGASSDW